MVKLPDNLADIISLARAALQQQKDRAGLLDGAASWTLSAFGGESKWAPLERRLERLAAAEDNEVSRADAASLARSLGVDLELPGRSKGETATDAGDAGVRAAEATIGTELVQSARDLASGAANKIPSVLEMVPGSIVVGGVGLLISSAVGGPLGLLVAAGSLGYAVWDWKRSHAAK